MLTDIVYIELQERTVGDMGELRGESVKSASPILLPGSTITAVNGS